MHLAAESHVDRSIDGPADFVKTNVVGTYVLLEAPLRTGGSRPGRALPLPPRLDRRGLRRAGRRRPASPETTRYDPSSPYSASKAASDHLVRAWHHTYGLPVRHHQLLEQLRAVSVSREADPADHPQGLGGEPMPVYGNGANVRDWLYVDDHAQALTRVLEQGRAGETYNIGGNAERRNIEVVTAICDAMDGLAPRAERRAPRPDHLRHRSARPRFPLRDRLRARSPPSSAGVPQHSFETGLAHTVHWYLDNRAWWQPLAVRSARRRRAAAASPKRATDACASFFSAAPARSAANSRRSTVAEGHGCRGARARRPRPHRPRRHRAS